MTPIFFSTPPVPTKKRIRLFCKVKSTTVVPKHLSSQIANFKRKVRKLIKSGVHASSPDGCTLPSTPKQIGELLLEGAHIDKKAFQAGIQILREDNLFKRDVLYKWRNKTKEQNLNPQNKFVLVVSYHGLYHDAYHFLNLCIHITGCLGGVHITIKVADLVW